MLQEYESGQIRKLLFHPGGRIRGVQHCAARSSWCPAGRLILSQRLWHQHTPEWELQFCRHACMTPQLSKDSLRGPACPVDLHNHSCKAVIKHNRGL